MIKCANMELMQAIWLLCNLEAMNRLTTKTTPVLQARFGCNWQRYLPNSVGSQVKRSFGSEITQTAEPRSLFRKVVHLYSCLSVWVTVLVNVSPQELP